MKPHFLLLCLFLPVMAGCLGGSKQTANKPMPTLTVSKPLDWSYSDARVSSMDRMFEMMLERNDHGVLLSVGKFPGSPAKSVQETQQLMHDVKQTSISNLGHLTGTGVFAQGLNSNGNSMAYVYFTPAHGSPLQDYYLIGIFQVSDKASEDQFEAIVNSLRVVPPGGK